MRALAMKEKCTSVLHRQVVCEIKKTKSELSTIENQRIIFQEKYKSHLLQSRATPSRFPEVTRSLDCLKGKISLMTKRSEQTHLKLNSLVEKLDNLNLQVNKISEKKNLIKVAEKDKKESAEFDLAIELQGTLRCLPDKYLQQSTVSKLKIHNVNQNLEVTQKVPSEISVSILRADGLPAQLQVVLEPVGKVAATLQTSINNQSDRDELQRKMKRALTGQADELEIVIKGEES